MSYNRVQQVARKFAENNLNDQYQAQRERIELFSDNLLRKLRASLNELEGDLFVLKEKKFDKTSWKELGQFWRDLIEIYKKIDEKRPYDGVGKLVNYIKSKKDWLLKIIPAIRKHLKENEVDFGPSKTLIQARADGLKKVILLVEEMGQYVKKNPLLADPREMKTVPPPPRGALEVIPDPEFKPVGPDQGTKVDVPIKKEVG
jgi:hypothetical protein